MRQHRLAGIGRCYQFDKQLVHQNLPKFYTSILRIFTNFTSFYEFLRIFMNFYEFLRISNLIK